MTSKSHDRSDYSWQIGNATTAPSDIENRDDALGAVVACVVMCLREPGFQSRNIGIAVRNVSNYNSLTAYAAKPIKYAQ